MVLRVFLQSKGLFTASRVPTPAPDGRWGRAWCHVPRSRSDTTALFAEADGILEGRLKIFGHPVAMPGRVPDWNADPVTCSVIGPSFGPLIDFRHIGDGVDIKYLWELNRHLWWVPLAQCYALSGRRVYLDRLRVLLASWLEACPYPLGANWSSPVEHGVRLVNWSLVWHLIGGEKSPMFEGDDGARLREGWLTSIYQHIRFASDNYSQYSSANNHLVGEATGVYVAARTWDRWAATRRLGARAKAILEREALRQFSADGVNLEQATGYHKFCLQFFLAAGLVGRADGDDFSAAYWARIDAAMTGLAALTDCRGNVPCIGDSDDAEVWRLSSGPGFDGYRALLALGALLFSRGDLQAKVDTTGDGADARASWLLRNDPPAPDLTALARLPTRFEQGGYVLIGSKLHTPDEFRVVFDCGPLGMNRIAGHGHADALSVLVSSCGEPLLVDAGTYCYNSSPELRHFFRGTSAHNTLVVDGLDQSDYGGSFLWLRDVNAALVPDGDARSVHARHDGYGRLADPVIHHRRVTLAPDGRGVLVEDWLECSTAHTVELLWHAAPGARLSPLASGERGWRLDGQRRSLQITLEPPHEARVIEACESPAQGWVSTRFYERTPAPVLSIHNELQPGQVLATKIVMLDR
jgi:hypothetical protein